MIRALRNTAAVFAGIALLSGCSQLPAPDAKRNESGAIEKEARADAYSIKVGDCLNDPGEGEINNVSVVPCAQPHELEVFHEFLLAGENYPATAEAMEESVLSTCDPVFKSFIGRSYDDSDLDYTTIEPTEESWKDGDRMVHCLVGNADFSKESGSLKGSNR